MPCLVVGRWLVDIQYPALTPVGGPLDQEVLDGLGEVVGGDVDVTRVAGTAHGDVGELSTPAVGENVTAVDGCALHAVDGDGICRLGAARAKARSTTPSTSTP